MATVSIVVLDTDVYSLLYITPPRSASQHVWPIDRWKSSLTGCRVLIAFQTRAEILAGARSGGWGARRVADAMTRLDATPTIDADRDVVDAYAELSAAARQTGHPLGAKEQIGDRWVAACAIAKDVPLLTGNRKHFAGAPRLFLRPF